MVRRFNHVRVTHVTFREFGRIMTNAHSAACTSREFAVGFWYRRAVIALWAACALSPSAYSQTDVAAPVAPPKVVLELFTSQGCSSCPPADALLESYTKRDDVIALSVPVDYWDRLGWKDLHASRAHTDRQRDYAVARGDGQIYTPQIVVNGATHVIGSSRAGIDKAIDVAKEALFGSKISLRLRSEGDVIIVQIGDERTRASGPAAQVLLAVVQDSGTVAIRRGENANRSVTYFNIVRSLKQIGIWNGLASTLRLPKSDGLIGDTQSLVVLVQQGKGGPIRGAAQLRLIE